MILRPLVALVVTVSLVGEVAMAQGDVTAPSPVTVVAEDELDASPFAWRTAAGTWCAWVESLPQAPHHRQSAARFVPWQVVRRAGAGETEVVLRWDDRGELWPARITPAHVVVDAAGTVIAADRWGSRFVVLPAGGGPSRVHALPDTVDGEIVRLDPEGVLRKTTEFGKGEGLTWNPLRADGFGATVAVPLRLAPSSGAQAYVVRAGSELVWCSAPDALTALDVVTGATRAIGFPDAAAFTLERAAGGWLFACAEGKSERCFYRELRLTNLATGEIVARPPPSLLAAWTQHGLFTPNALHDPVRSRHVRFARPLWTHGVFVPIDAATLAYRPRDKEPWRLLQLDESETFTPEPIAAALAAVVASLDRGTGLDSPEFRDQLVAVGPARCDEAIQLYARVLRSNAGYTTNWYAVSMLCSGGNERARAPLREALEAAESWSAKLQIMGCLAIFLEPADARVIEVAFPVESFPSGTRSGDTAAKVAEQLAVIGAESSTAYLVALFERAPLAPVGRALESVRNAARFRAALAAARDG